MRGLGIREMTTRNIGLLRKLGWRIVSEPHSILAKVIAAK